MKINQVFAKLNQTYPTLGFKISQLFTKDQHLPLTTKVNVSCPKHGDSVSSLEACIYRGKACLKCYSEANPRVRSSSTGKWYKTRSLSNIQLDVNSVYGQHKIKVIEKSKLVNGSPSLLCECVEHGPFEVAAVLLLSNKQGCPVCGDIRKKTKLKSTREEFISSLSEEIRDTYDLTDLVYTGIKDKINVKCKIHGEFLITADNFKHGNGCKKCGALSRGEAYKKTGLKNLLNKLEVKFSDKLSWGKMVYTGFKEEIVLTCHIHGDFITTPLYIHQSKKDTVCPFCTGSVICAEDLDSELSEKYRPLESLRVESVVNTRDDVMIKCLRCGHTFYNLIQNLRGYPLLYCIRCVEPYLLLGSNKRFSDLRPHEVYVIEIVITDGSRVYKVGYSNNSYDRLHGVKFNNSVVSASIIFFKEYKNAAEAYISEQRTLDVLKDYQYTEECLINNGGNTELLTIDPSDTIDAMVF